MRTPIRTLLAATALAALAGCATAEAAPPPTAAPSAPTAPDPAATLLVAVNGYTAALLAGDGPGVGAYVAPACAAQRGEAVLAAGMLAKSAAGARMTYTTVRVDGAHGRGDAYTLAGAGDAFTRLVGQAETATAARDAAAWPWRYADGTWAYHPASCTA